MGIINEMFRRKPRISWIVDSEYIQDKTTKVYIKRIALQTCIEFLARSISQSEFRITDKNKLVKDKTYYKLNVRPNTDSSAADFWQKVIYKLIYDNEVLIVVSDTKDLLVADSFERNRFALYDDVFSHVMIDEYEFKRTFDMDEVIYLTYNNHKLNEFTEGLFEDYGDLFGRMIQAQMRNYQTRAILNLKTKRVTDEEEAEEIKAYTQKIFKSFTEDAVAVAPLTENLEYQDVSSTGKSNNAPFEDLNKLQKSVIDNVAKAIGIPPSLIHGEMADLSNALDSYNKFCIRPILKKIEDELNAKLFTEKEILRDKRLKIVSVDKRDPLEMAEAIDKLIASGTFNRNQVRIMLGEEPIDDKDMDIYFITKNYENPNHKNSLKGGEKDEATD